MEEHVLPKNEVLIVGGGPVGMFTAAVLAYFGVRSTVLERNDTTTRWPKMDLTNARSMELFRKLGLADSLRSRGVPSQFPYNVLMTTGLNRSDPITRWNLISVDEYNKSIRTNNDGAQPVEPYQRISQAVFEAWMKDICDANPLIDLRFGWKMNSLEEKTNGVETLFTETRPNVRHTFRASYVVGCDGASSRTRRSLNISLEGGPLPITFLLVHFKSHDLSRLHKQGRFWHLFILKDKTFGGAVISQDEKDVFTVHYPVAPGVDPASVGSEEAVYAVLGGQHGPYEVTIDEVLVRSIFTPSITVASSFAGPELRVFLAGDSAHQNVPTGGYGMNTGLGDAFDIGWKLAAVLNGQAHPDLLHTYELERWPVVTTNVERSGVHNAVHLRAVEMLGAGGGVSTLDGCKGPATAQQLRGALHKLYQENDGENKDLGIEMGYRYVSPVCIPGPKDASAPAWVPEAYRPTTIPGSRPPHVFLSDGTAISDHFGKHYTLVEFVGSVRAETGSAFVIDAARSIGMPLTYVRLENENKAAQLWEQPLVLVRPDQHVSWRAESVESQTSAESTLRTILGHHLSV